MDGQYPWPCPYDYDPKYEDGVWDHTGQQSPPSTTPCFQDYHDQQQQHQSWEDILGMAEVAFITAWQHLLNTGESVSAWQVSQAALLSLHADSWSSLGLEMQQLPSLRAFIAAEAKVHAFIHCFVNGRGLTSLYDLETAICKNENIDRFEELAMGPFLQHPLVKHYFPLNGEVSEVLKISTEEIVSHLADYLYIVDCDQVVIEEFLNFLAQKKSVTAKEKLGVRIHSLLLHISFIQEARRSEHASSRLSLEKKQQLGVGENRNRVEFPPGDYLSNSLGDDILGRSFSDSSSHDEHSDDLSKEVKRDELTNTKGKVTISHLDGTPVTLPVEKNAVSHSFADWLKQDMKDRDAILTDKASYTKKGKKKISAMLVMETSALRVFIKRWKEACRNCSLAEVLEMMILEYQSPKRSVKMVNLVEQPVLGLLNVALASIRCGILDEIYDAIGKESLPEIIRSGEDQSDHCGPIKSCVSANTKSPVECVREEGPKAYNPLTLPFSNVKAEDISASLMSPNTTLASEIPESGSRYFKYRDRLNTGMPDEEVAVQTGRAGELFAFRHFCKIYGKKSVTWVNEDSETGKPYDITVTAEGGTGLRYIEVKATRSINKDWFFISTREWEFAAGTGESFSIAHVLLVENNTRIRIFNDPVKLCRQKELQLAVLMPK